MEPLEEINLLTISLENLGDTIHSGLDFLSHVEPMIESLESSDDLSLENDQFQALIQAFNDVGLSLEAEESKADPETPPEATEKSSEDDKVEKGSKVLGKAKKAVEKLWERLKPMLDKYRTWMDERAKKVDQLVDKTLEESKNNQKVLESRNG